MYEAAVVLVQRFGEAWSSCGPAQLESAGKRPSTQQLFFFTFKSFALQNLSETYGAISNRAIKFFKFK